MSAELAVLAAPQHLASMAHGDSAVAQGLGRTLAPLQGGEVIEGRH